MTETTHDLFLGGRLTIEQPRRGYRAGADPVFLAASISARAGDRVLELGCGVGTALCCLMARVPGVICAGVERQADLADLAVANVRRNGFAADIHTADLADLHASLRAQSFDHVMLNPPWFDRSRGAAAMDAGREQGRGLDTPLPVWFDVAIRRTAPRGRLAAIFRAECLPDIMAAVDSRLGDLRLTPLAARQGRDAELVVLTARKGARGPATLAAPIILHDGVSHDGDRDSYSAVARAVLRDGKSLFAVD